MNDNFSYAEEVIINDALNKENALALTESYRITFADYVRAIAFINITEYKTKDDLKCALLEFKTKHKLNGTRYGY